MAVGTVLTGHNLGFLNQGQQQADGCCTSVESILSVQDRRWVSVHRAAAGLCRAYLGKPCCEMCPDLQHGEQGTWCSHSYGGSMTRGIAKCIRAKGARGTWILCAKPQISPRTGMQRTPAPRLPMCLPRFGEVHNCLLSFPRTLHVHPPSALEQNIVSAKYVLFPIVLSHCPET